MTDTAAVAISTLPSAVDKRIRAVATIRTLKTTLEPLDPYYPVYLDQIEQFHGALDHLAEIGEDVTEFRVPPGLIEPPNRRGGQPRTDRIHLSIRVLRVLDYLAIRQAVLKLAERMTEQPARLIGYPVPART